MKKEEVISVFKDVIEKANYEEFLTVSDNVNQLADIMIYSHSHEDDMFAIDGEPLFPVCQIKNILYDFGKDKSSYTYVGTEIMFILELKDGSSFVIEDGEQCRREIFFLNRQQFTDYKKIRKALKVYNDKLRKRSFVFGLFHTIATMVETGEVIDIDLLPISKEIFHYIDNNPADNDFLFYFAHKLLCLLVINDSDLFDINSVLRKIVENAQVDEFLKYVEDYYIDSDGNIYLTEYYLILVSCALNKIHELESENVEAVNN